MNRLFSFILLAAVLSHLSSCREDEFVIYSDEQDTGVGTVAGEIVGMYLLNEGNMGSNKSTLDFLDLSGAAGTVRYHRNIYSERNPHELKELGDVGNDIKVYGSQLWMVINCSNKVEVATVDSCKKIAKIDIPNCRYLAFDQGYAYVSSYVGPVSLSSNAPLGRVYKVDTLTFAKVDSVVVGYQPDELVVHEGKLYVANSGGYRVPHYDQTVSQIDLATFRVERTIDVAPNLHRIRADKYGQLWVTSRGKNTSSTASLVCLHKNGQGEMVVADTIKANVSDMCIVGDSLYFFGVDFSMETFSNKATYGIINVRTHQVIADRLSLASEMGSIETPYGIIVNPIHKDFYLMDAKDYVSSGELLHFNADGTFDWRVWTGDIPGHAAFVHKQKNSQ